MLFSYRTFLSSRSNSFGANAESPPFWVPFRHQLTLKSRIGSAILKLQSVSIALTAFMRVWSSSHPWSPVLRALALRSLPALEAIGRTDLSRKRLKTASQGVDNTAAMAVYATVESNRRLRRCSTAGRRVGTCTSLERPGQAFMSVVNGWPSDRATLFRCSGPDGATRPKQRTAPRQTWSGTSSNVNVAGASRLSVRVLPSRVPVERRGPSRDPPPERCHRSGRAPAEQRRRRRPSSEPYPEIAAPCGVAAQWPSRRSCAASHRARTHDMA